MPIFTLKDIDRFRDDYRRITDMRNDLRSFIVKLHDVDELGLNFLPPDTTRGQRYTAADGHTVATVVARLHPDKEERDMRLLAIVLTDGVRYCDTAYEERGEYKVLALLPNGTEPYTFGPVQWVATHFPVWLRTAILADVAQRALAANVEDQHADRELKSIL